MRCIIAAQLMVVERMLGLWPHLTRQMQQRMAEAEKRSGLQLPD